MRCIREKTHGNTFLPQRYRNLYTTSYFLTLIQYIVYIMSIFYFFVFLQRNILFCEINVNKIRNMKKLRFLFLSIVLFITLGVMGEEGVLLQLKNGSIVGFAFSDKPTMLIGSALEIRAKKTVVSYDYNEVKRVYWGEVQPNSISSAKDNVHSDVIFRINSNSLSVFGLSKGEHVSIYDTTGRLITTAISTKDNENFKLIFKNI